MATGLNKLGEDTKKVTEEAQSLEDVFKNIQTLIDAGKYKEAQKEMENFLAGNVELAKKINVLEEDRKNKTEETFKYIKSMISSNGDLTKIATEALDADTIDLVREKLTEYFKDFENGQDIVDGFFDTIAGGLEASSGLLMFFSSLVSPINQVGKLIKNAITISNNEKIPPIWEEFGEAFQTAVSDAEKGYDRYSKKGAKQLFEDLKVASEQMVKTNQDTISQRIESEAQENILDTAETKRIQNISNKRLQAEAQKKALAEAEAERLKKEQERAALAVEFQEGLNNRKIKEIKTVEAAQIDDSGMQDILAQNNIKIAKQTEEAEKASLKTRAEQWKEYAEKVSAISNQISEVTSMVASSLGGMFGQLAESYSEQIESINGKIAAVDEEKKAALERATLSEDERTAREEELAQQKLALESTTTDEQRNKADQRIAILEGELGAEDSINRDFDSKKASLEKEKEKKEKEKKKAEKMKKRLEMGQAIVEAVGNVAQGVTVALAKGPILGPILASIVGAAGAIQVGIMSKQLAKMEDGGLLGGKRHSQGGMRILGSNIEVEGGEYVVNRQSTDKNLGLLSYINSQRRELAPADIGSFFSRTSMPLPTNTLADMLSPTPLDPPMMRMENSSNRELIDAIQNLRIDSKVAVTDIISAHDRYTSVEDWVGM